MNFCKCGCGTLVKNMWVRNHQYRVGRGNAPVDPEVSEQITQALVDLPFALPEDPPSPDEPPPEEPSPQPVVYGPPPHPFPLDRRRWRLASERPSTPLSDPWIETKCHNCRERMWTRDPTSTWEQGGICEECDYLLHDKMYDIRRSHLNLQVRAYIDPFRPR